MPTTRSKADKSIEAQLAEIQAQMQPKSRQQQAQDAILQKLDELSGEQVSDDAVVFRGAQFVLPEVLDGDLAKGVDFLRQIAQAEEAEFNFNRTYNYRPNDGAAAFQRAMLRVFGTSGVGKRTYTLFGSHPPEYISIAVGVDQQLQVPWGEITFSPLKAVFQLGAVGSPDGPLFYVGVEAPKKHRRRIDGFLRVVEDELKTRSIYRGKAIDASDTPNFIDLSTVDADKVIYARDVRASLEANFWSVIDYADQLRKLRRPLKRAVLLEGKYGTGKTLTGVVTGQRAVAGGWTYIQVRAGDDPYAAMKTARLYAPCVVWIEDLDVHMAGKDRTEVSKLLDALDNVNNKGAEVMVGFTTNFPDVLERGVLRPGRIDAVVHIGALDEDGFERLVKAVIPAQMLDEIDYSKVAQSFVGYEPAFATEAADRALRYAIVRGEGKLTKINTDDLVGAGNGLRDQHDMLEAADETRHSEVSLESLITATIEEASQRTVLTGVGAPFQVLDKNTGKFKE